MISRFAGIVRPLHHIDTLSGLVHLLTKTLTLEEYICSSHLIHKKKICYKLFASSSESDWPEDKSRNYKYC